MQHLLSDKMLFTSGHPNKYHRYHQLHLMTHTFYHKIIFSVVQIIKITILTSRELT